jgi:hypothetical protein
VTADQNRHVRRGATHSRGKLDDVVGFKRMHAGDADQAGAPGAQIVLDGAAESKVGDGSGVALSFESRRDVGHAERLDAEERAKAEALVDRNGPQEQHVHRGSAERSTLGGLLYSHGPHGLIVRTRGHLGA